MAGLGPEQQRVRRQPADVSELPATNAPDQGPANTGWIRDPAENGITTHRSETKPASISDGTSNTFFAAEKYMNNLQYYNGTGCCGQWKRL